MPGSATVKERSLALGAQARGYLPLKEERDTVGDADATAGDNQAPRPGDVELGIDMTEETVRGPMIGDSVEEDVLLSSDTLSPASIHDSPRGNLGGGGTEVGGCCGSA